MKLHYVLTCCLAIAHLSSDSVEARTLTTYNECPKPETPCYGCKYNERCCGVREKVCNEQCKKVCKKTDGTKRPILTKCPTKKKCKEVPPASCNGNKGCSCTPLPPSQCKPVCKIVEKEVCTQPDCFSKEDCREPCLDKECKIKCDLICPPKECNIVEEEICDTPSCEKCVSCAEVPDCSVRCGDGYCDGSAGESCKEDCTTTCPERFVPRCVPARPVRSKTPDDEKKKKRKKKGYSSGSESDSDSSNGSDSDSDSSNGSDSDSDSSGSDSDSDSSGCGSDSDSDDCYRKRHN